MQGDCNDKEGQCPDSRPSSISVQVIVCFASCLPVSGFFPLTLLDPMGWVCYRRAEQGRGVQNGLATDKEGKSPADGNKKVQKMEMGPETMLLTAIHYTGQGPGEINRGASPALSPSWVLGALFSSCL